MLNDINVMENSSAPIIIKRLLKMIRKERMQESECSFHVCLDGI